MLLSPTYHLKHTEKDHLINYLLYYSYGLDNWKATNRRVLSIRPMTRDGGAHLATSRNYKFIRKSHYAHFKREAGRM